MHVRYFFLSLSLPYSFFPSRLVVFGKSSLEQLVACKIFFQAYKTGGMSRFVFFVGFNITSLFCLASYSCDTPFVFLFFQSARILCLDMSCSFVGLGDFIQKFIASVQLCCVLFVRSLNVLFCFFRGGG